MGGAADSEGGGAATPLFVLSFRQLDELAQLASGAGWRVVGARAVEGADFTGSGAAVALVDARGALAEGLAAVRGLAPEVDRAGAALLVLVSRGDRSALGPLLDAGATHFLVSPAGEDELIQALRYAERYAAKAGGQAPPPAARRREDVVPLAQVGDAVRRWAAGRLAAGRPVVVARVGLASFELVNSAHGRAAGDLILDQAATRLRDVAGRLFGGDAIVARASGPEFLLAGDARAADPARVEGAVAAALATPFGAALVGSRVGVAASRAGEDAGALIRRAGEAIAPVDDRAAIEALAIDLHHAIGAGEIGVLFQPQVEVATGRIVGAEALARWTHQRSGPIGAEPLFAAAARAGLELALSEHVQRLALGEAATWPAALGAVRLSVNVTAGDIGAPDFAERFLQRVAATGFPADRLTAEVTETGLIEDLERAARVLARLRAAGCRTAIDDFGAGYAGLTYLNALPIDYLKLDKALVVGTERPGRERVVVQGVLSLARSLGLKVVAEGVETPEQRDFLAGEGCELYQGFLCAGALDAAALARLVEGE